MRWRVDGSGVRRRTTYGVAPRGWFAIVEPFGMTVFPPLGLETRVSWRAGPSPSANMQSCLDHSVEVEPLGPQACRCVCLATMSVHLKSFFQSSKRFEPPAWQPEMMIFVSSV